MYKKILVPLDGSPLAEAVLPHAQELAKLGNGEIVILRVAAEPAAEFAFSDPALADSVVKRLEEEAKAYMETEIAKLQKEGAKVSSVIREGAIAETVLKVAEETKADVIAMSTHGHSGTGRWLMGSVADRVVSHSKVPVLLIHPN
jgi:nucleotide-binding universal stress UspA family protein